MVHHEVGDAAGETTPRHGYSARNVHDSRPGREPDAILQWVSSPQENAAPPGSQSSWHAWWLRAESTTSSCTPATSPGGPKLHRATNTGGCFAATTGASNGTGCIAQARTSQRTLLPALVHANICAAKPGRCSPPPRPTSAEHLLAAAGPGPAANRAARAGGHHLCMCRRQSRGHLLLPTPVGSVSTAAGGWLVLKCLLPAPAHALARAASGWLVLNCLLPAPAHAE